MTIAEFLMARYDEDEAVARDTLANALAPWDQARQILYRAGWHSERAEAHIERWHPARVLADIAAKRAIVALHESWPVLVEGKPEFEASSDVAEMVMRVTRQIAWLTNQEYRKRFGDEPPTAPMLRALAQPYIEHADFDPAWTMT